MIQRHRLLGLGLTDYFGTSPFGVATEKDLSQKQQFLDIVIYRPRPGDFTERLPDGLEDPANHNLTTFKSHQQTLDDDALDELLGHAVNYRKQVSPSFEQLRPKEEIRLLAICARYPHNLAGQVTLEELKPGVYQCRWGTRLIRVIVLRRVSLEAHNALWLLFSGVPERIAFAAQHYRQRSAETSTWLDQLFEGYQREGMVMPYTMEDFRRDYLKEHLSQLSVEDRLAGLSPEEIRQRLTPEERLAGLSAEEILQRLPREEIENFLRRRPNGSPPAPQ